MNITEFWRTSANDRFWAIAFCSVIATFFLLVLAYENFLRQLWFLLWYQWNLRCPIPYSKLKNFSSFLIFDRKFPKQKIYQRICCWKLFLIISSSHWDLLIRRYPSVIKVRRISKKVLGWKILRQFFSKYHNFTFWWSFLIRFSTLRSLVFVLHVSANIFSVL